MQEELYKRILYSFPNSKYLGIKHTYNAGQSGAPVFVVQYTPENDYGLDGAFIVKIGSEEWAKAEAALYQSLSSSALASLLTRRHMPSSTVEGQAAVAYDIAFNSLRTPQPLMDILDNREGQSEEETQKQIESLSQALVNWYLNGKLADNSVVEDPHMLLLRMLTPRRSDLLKRLKDTLSFWSSDTWQVTIQGLNSRLPNPLAYMQKKTWQEMKAAGGLHCPLGRIHGDLHTGNIICLPLSQSLPKIIDFDQSIAEGVPFFDLAYLEFDIMRHLLPIEHKENRSHWLSLLNFSMAETEGEQQALPWNVTRTWEFIKPIRQGMLQLEAFGGEDYGIVRWLATVAVGLNFARKGKLERSSFERMAGLLYAAYGLARTLKGLCVKEVMTEHTSFVPWLQGEANSPLSPDLPISLPSQENFSAEKAAEVNLSVPIETSQDTEQVAFQPTPLNLSLDQDPLVVPESVMEFFEDAASLSNEANGDVMEESRPDAEYMPKTAEKSASRADVGNTSVETAEKIRNLLQKSLDRFNAGGPVYRDVCDAANSALQQLEAYLQEANKKTAQTSYEISFLLEGVLTLQKDARSALQSFRQFCPPLNTRRLDPHYNDKRVDIARMLDETLAKFLELLKKFE